MSAKEKLIGLLDYVEELARLPEQPVFSVRNYRTLLYYEHQLRGRTGIQHDVVSEEGTEWLRIERLQRRRPPVPEEPISDWIVLSQDPSKVPETSEAILRTMPRDQATKLVTEGLVDQSDVMESPQGDEDTVDVRLLLDRQPEIKEEIQKYIRNAWRQWSDEEKPRRETIAVYDKFFSVAQAIETAGVDNPLEVVLGVGMALWRTSGKTIEHPLIEALVEVSIDPSSHAIHIQTRETEPQIYLKPFTELGNDAVPSLRRNALTHIERFSHGNEAESEPDEFSPFLQASFEPILRDAVRLLSSDAQYYPDVAEDVDDRRLPGITEQLTITDTWAIYVRPRSMNLFAQDIQKLKQAIEEGDEADFPIPSKRFVTAPEDVPQDDSGPDLNLGLGASVGTYGGTPSVTETHDCDVFFPKPYNDAQIKIIRRLEREDGIVVQGPPGTGKTHTIANIICHYLATGRNVLVVSKGEPALEVLRNQIPEEVRKLTISLLTSERQGLKQLEAAVTFMANSVVNKDPARLDQRRIEREREILDLQGKIEKLDLKVRSCAEKQLKQVPQELCGSSTRWPAELAKTLTEEKDRHAWLEDALTPEGQHNPRFSDEDVRQIRQVRCRLGDDLAYLDRRIPSVNDLPDANTLCSVHEDLVQATVLSEAAERENTPRMSTSSRDSVERAERVRNDLQRLSEYLGTLEQYPWVRQIYEVWLASGVKSSKTKLLNNVIATLLQAEKNRQTFLQRPVNLPNMRVDRKAVITAAQRAERGERPFSLLSFGNSESKEYLNRIRVLGKVPATRSTWAHVCRYFNYQDELLSLATRWNAIASEYGLPQISEDYGAVEGWVSETRKLFQETYQAVAGYGRRLNDDVTLLFSSAIDDKRLRCDITYVRQTIETLESNITRVRLSSARSMIVTTVDSLGAYDGTICQELLSFLRDSVGNGKHTTKWIGDRWRDLLRELKRVRNLRADLETVERISVFIKASGSPKWAQRLRTVSADKHSDTITPSHWEDSWRFCRLESYLRDIDAREELRSLSEQHSDYSHRLTRAMAEVVQLRTYIGLCKRMQSGGRLSALMRFVHAIRQIGAGKGIRARRYRGDARNAMLECLESVPCWIMPTWRVSESLPAKLGAFDLVIVDEASQSDVMALPTLFRAKKVLIVGDDRQVSPSTVGLEERKLLQLRHSFLRGQPFADMLLPGTSLYDMAQAVFPGGRILLNEHFRCVEPIIRFSLQFYPEEIVPLRIPKPSERLDPPLIDVYVANGARDSNKVNKAEAIAIVDEIERLTGDPHFEKRSIGVVSLIGNKQAHVIQNLLLERIGEDAFLRHRIACGDSATFQGKERDVMFLSMIACPGQAHAQVSRLFEQRFNVALSRARDRMYLFRSVKPEDLSNPRDLKARVVNHFRNPMPVAAIEARELLSLCESDFEKDVFRRLVSLGYRVTPQVAVGDYRIDLVIDGANDRRLAVELDGDRYHGPDRWFEDWNRQKTLERVGWKFWRCWASSFLMAPDECMGELVGVLNDMKIEPIGQEDVKHQYTEHRTISVELPAEVVEASSGESRETVAEIGDRVVVAFDQESNRQYMLTLSADGEDLVNGIVSVDSPTGAVLVGARVEDELDIPWKDERRHAVVLQITKTATSTSPSPVDGEVIPESAPAIHDSDIGQSSEDSASDSELPEVLGTSDPPAWQMTRGEYQAYCNSQGHTDVVENNKAYWREIETAVDSGKSVPSEILAQFRRIKGQGDAGSSETHSTEQGEPPQMTLFD